MKPKFSGRTVCVLLVLVCGLVACGKKSEAPAEAAPAPAPAAAAPAVDAAADAAASEAASKKKAIERALAEQAIVDDAKGQWASAATASSTYAGEKDPASTASYAPSQATGKPNVENYGDDSRSWAPAQADGGIEWLQLDFATPASARELRIRQNNAPGAIIKLELIDEAGERHMVWQGVDDATYDSGTVYWFVRSFEPTPYKARSARVTLATNAVSGWNEIDAVQLVGP
jgi:hypothetical protein